MENVKYIFGSIMIGMALYYVYPVAHAALFDGLLATAFIGVSIYFGALKKLSPLSSPITKIKKSFLILLFVMGLIFVIKAITPKHMAQKLFPMAQSGSKNQTVNSPEWFNYSDELLQKALAEKKPVIIDFKADWCLACKELELYTFSNNDVLDLGKEFIWMAFDATSPSDELDKLQKRYGIGGLPYIVIYDNQGAHRKDLTLTGFEDASSFLARMKEALK